MRNRLLDSSTDAFEGVSLLFQFSLASWVSYKQSNHD